MDSAFMRTFGHVSIVHLVIISGMVLYASAEGCFRFKKETIIPIEFKIVVPADMVEVKPRIKEASKTPEIKESDIPEISKPVVKPRPKDQTPKIKVDKPVPKPRPDVKPLSAEEIKKRLLQGAEISDHNVIPEDETLIYRKILHDVFYAAWQQPSRADVGDVTVEAEVVLGPDGSVVSRRIIRKSRSPLLDDSVEQALQAVTRVNGLTPEYIRQKNPFIVTFRVEEM
jgi:outer membrane biosynthesis protein TonB